MVKHVADFIQDCWYGFRWMRRRSGFVVVTVLTLALGIAASTSVFSVVSAVLLKPLPYPDADRLVLLVGTFRGRTLAGISVPRLSVWREHTNVFQEIAIYRVGNSMSFSNGHEGAQVMTGRVSASFFSLFGASVVQGRVFTNEEDRFHGPRVAVLSYGFWQRKFGASPGIIGQTIVLEGAAYEVVGVLSAAFDPRSSVPFATLVSQPPDVWVPLQPDWSNPSDANNLFVAARLRPDVPLATAQEQTRSAAAALRKILPKESMPDGLEMTVRPLKDVIVEGVRPSLLLLAASVAFVLLIVIVNTTCLLLVRAADRQRELAIRIATGASRGRLVRQLLTESLVLALMGGTLGLVLGVAGIRSLLALQPGDLPRIAPDGSGMVGDWRVLMFAIVASASTGVAVGVLPAIRASRLNVEEQLRAGGERAGAGFHHETARALLVVSEVALASMLLVGTGLLIRSFVEIRRVPPGFDTQRLLTMTTLVTDERYTVTKSTTRLMEDAVRDVGAVPGVEIMGATLTGIPLEGEKTAFKIGIAGQPDRSLMGAWHVISPDYLQTLKTPLIRGRGFTSRDDSHSPPVVVINQALVGRFWPTGEPLGDSLILGEGVGPDFVDVPRQIIGIVGDMRQDGLDRDPRPTAYVPLAQLPDNEMAFFSRAGAALTWVVRTSQAPDVMTASVVEALRKSTKAPVARIRSMQEVSALSTAGTQFEVWLMTLFGWAALLLAALGVYGVVSYSVQQRAREIGVRLALGATPSTIQRMVLGRSIGFTMVGIAIGIAAAFGLARVLARFLFGIAPHDAMVFAIVPCALSLVALIAVWLPARRAARVDPVTALRAE